MGNERTAGTWLQGTTPVDSRHVGTYAHARDKYPSSLKTRS